MNVRTCGWILFLGGLVLAVASSRAQPQTVTLHLALRTPPSLVALSHQADEGSDPGYETYKKGYQLVLNERWDEAREVLGQVKSRFPNSEYVDDAEYWSAYALMHKDREKAVQAYKQFIKSCPKSSYYDDAVADLAQLQMDAVSDLVKSHEDVMIVRPHSTVRPLPRVSPVPQVYTYGLSAEIRQAQRAYRRASRSIWTSVQDTDKIDPGTRVKMEALYALGDAKEDDASFQTLKEVALDMRQRRELREAALETLLNFRKHDVLPILVDVVKKDTNEELQVYAIDFIAQTRDKNRSVNLLIELYNSLPGSRMEPRETLFYSIAEVGNDRAVDFLKSIALTHENYDLRRDAVYYLGNIGGEKAREALYEIIKSK